MKYLSTRGVYNSNESVCNGLNKRLTEMINDMKQIERKNMMRELFIHAGCMKGMSQMIVYMQDEIKGGDKDYSCRMLERMRDIMLEEVEKVEKIAEQIQEELDLP